MKVRDETKSYNRFVDYKSDWDNSTQTDTVGQADSTIAQWPKVTIIYKDPVSKVNQLKYNIKGKVKLCELYSITGRKIAEYQIADVKLLEKKINRCSKGFYIMKIHTTEGIYHKKYRVNKDSY